MSARRYACGPEFRSDEKILSIFQIPLSSGQSFILKNIQIVASADLGVLENEDKRSLSIGGNPGKKRQFSGDQYVLRPRLVWSWHRDDHSA